MDETPGYRTSSDREAMRRLLLVDSSPQPAATAPALTRLQELLALGPEDRWLSSGSPSAAEGELEAALTRDAGAACVSSPASAAAAALGTEAITVWSTTSGWAAEFLGSGDEPGPALPASLRVVVLRGDPPSRCLIETLRQRLPGVSLFYLWGDERLSPWVAWARLEGEAAGVRLEAFAGYSLEVVAADGSACPPWVVGRLEASQASRPAVAPPPGGGPVQAARRLPEGGFELLGGPSVPRVRDGQTFFLGEVEAELLRLAGVWAGGVVEVGGELVASYWPARSGPTREEVRRALESALPPFLLPGRLRVLEALPLNRDGHLDRGQLAASGVTRDAPPAVGAGALEVVSRITSEVLDRPRLAPTDDLLAIGANSVDLIRIGNRLESELGVSIDQEVLFLEPTIGALARHVADLLERHSPPAATSRPEAPGEYCAALLLDPAEREAFKEHQPGLRKDLEKAAALELAGPPPDERLEALFRSRSSQREFDPGLLPSARFGNWLGCLRQLRLEGLPKYRYPSAGGIYGVQTYLHVKAGRVEAIPNGCYYYDPLRHRLLSLAPRVELERGIHDFINRKLFDQSAFTVLLVGRYDAMQPMYGAGAHDFLMYEAGSMGQLLMTEASSEAIGLCGVGSLRFDAIRHLFGLGEESVLLHALLGGAMPGSVAGRGAVDARAQQLLDKVRSLSDAEVRALLAEKRASAPEGR